MFSVMSCEPAKASAMACPWPSSDCAEQPLGPRARKRAMEQLRKMGDFDTKPGGETQDRAAHG